MKRKTFIKASAALATGSIIIPNIISCKSNAKPAATTEAITTPVVIRKNWAKNYQYKAKQLLSPSSVDELVTMVKNNKISKALGSTHCFNDIADSPEVQISTANLNKVISIDEANKTCTVESGVRYGQFAPELQQKNLALHNLASLPHISVAGACATATHGSGVENGNLATSVRAIELVTANGEVKDYSRDKDGDLFNGVVVHLGAMGIVTKVTLDLQKTFDVRQDLFQDLPLESLKHHFDEIMSSGYSVSLFTDWLNKKVSQIWIKRRMD
ncbi:MAG TPA: FAD-binding protein, partial [Bacteroidia bacterium]|nr:FAD-binding protein [Bacteroidia bacterium]